MSSRKLLLLALLVLILVALGGTALLISKLRDRPEPSLVLADMGPLPQRGHTEEIPLDLPLAYPIIEVTDLGVPTDFPISIVFRLEGNRLFSKRALKTVRIPYSTMPDMEETTSFQQVLLSPEQFNYLITLVDAAPLDLQSDIGPRPGQEEGCSLKFHRGWKISFQPTDRHSHQFSVRSSCQPAEVNALIVGFRNLASVVF